MRKFWARFQRRSKQKKTEEKGQGLVEYGLIIVLVGIAVILILNLMRPTIANVFSRMVGRAPVAPPSLLSYTPPPTYTPTPTIDPNATDTPTPTYTPVPWQLTVNVLGNGTVDINPDQSGYTDGENVTLTASPNPGWEFIGWSGDLSGTANPATVTMDSDKTIAATFGQVATTYQLTVNVSGSGSVAVNPDQPEYVEGSDVTLTAAAPAGWEFSGWSGDLSGTANPATVTMDSDKTITAIFTEQRHTLTVNTIGNGAVVVYPDQPDYSSDDVVSLNATADTGWAFSHWSGSTSGSANPKDITMDGDKSIAAHFVPCYTLTVNVTPNGTGNVYADPTPSCDNYTKYPQGTVVKLTADPGSGYVFSGWSGDASGSTNPLDVTVDRDKSVTASFVVPIEVIIDNNDANLSGNWRTSTSSSGYYGSNYVHDNNNSKGSNTARFRPNLPEAGSYRVYARWTSASNRATNVPIDINYAGGTDTVTVNQRQNGGQWVLLGTYTFNAGTGGNVFIRNDGTNGYVVADAVRFYKP
jgi:uncharacterized repeat protein (TIGR02543 family)